jgi:hypothetical protein
MVTITVTKKVDLPRYTTEDEAIAYVLKDFKGFFNDADLKVNPGQGRLFGSKNTIKEVRELKPVNEIQTEGVL